MMHYGPQNATAVTRCSNHGVRRVFRSSFRPFHRSCRSANGLRPLRQEPASHAIEIGHYLEREHPRGVLGQVPVSHFCKAPQPFDDVEVMLDEGARRVPVLVPAACGLRERVAARRALLKPRANAKASQESEGVVAVVAAVSVPHPFLPMQQFGNWVMSTSLAVVAVTVWTIAFRSVPMCTFMPKYH